MLNLLKTNSQEKQRCINDNHLISYASRKDGFDNNPSSFSSDNTKAETSAIIDQFNCLHVLPLCREKRKETVSQDKFKTTLANEKFTLQHRASVTSLHFHKKALPLAM